MAFGYPEEEGYGAQMWYIIYSRIIAPRIFLPLEPCSTEQGHSYEADLGYSPGFTTHWLCLSFSESVSCLKCEQQQHPSHRTAMTIRREERVVDVWYRKWSEGNPSGAEKEQCCTTQLFWEQGVSVQMELLPNTAAMWELAVSSQWDFLSLAVIPTTLGIFML